jgi:hypothetical protein
LPYNLKNMEEKKETVDIDNRDIIADHLKSIERDWAWLSRKTEIPYATIYSCFVQRNFKVSEDNLKLINTVLETSFE